MSAKRELDDKISSLQEKNKRNRKRAAALGLAVAVVVAVALILPALSITPDAATPESGFFLQSAKLEDAASPSVVTVKKSWSNADGSHDWPAGLEMDVSLYKVPVRNGVVENASEGELVGGIENPVSLSADQPEFSWTDLPVLDTEAYRYIVKEEQVAGYTTYAVQEDGSTAATDTAAVVGGTASFTNKENDNGKVAIQVTKNIEGANGERIDLFSDVTNTFTIKTSASDTPDKVVDVNKGSYSAPYQALSGYEETAEEPSAFDITVSGATAAQTLISGLAPGMYTITEDDTSIPDQIVDKEGKVWAYKETQILTEYAWRTDGDEGQYHYSAMSSKENGDYTAIPEIAGSYGLDLYNGRLDFIVNNIYELTDATAEVETMNIQLNKAWDRGGDPTPPDSGSVTFELHQVATTTVAEIGDDNNTDGESGEHGAGEITVQLYKSDKSTLIGYKRANIGDTVTFDYSANPWANTGILVERLYSYGRNSTYLFGTQASSLGDGSFSYTIQSVDIVDNVVKLYFQGDFQGFTLSSGSGADEGSSDANSTTQIDPDGSGFPKTITLTASDADGNLWKDLEEELLSKTVSTDGSTTKTTTYSYYLVEKSVTGLASAYTSLSFNGVGDEDHPISARSKGETVTVSATNSVPRPDDKFIKMHKNWVDQDGNELDNHPDEVLVDVYRVKLPSGIGASGGLEYVYTPFESTFIYNVTPSDPVGNGSTVAGDVVFQYYKNNEYIGTFYVQGDYVIGTFNAAQLDEMIKGLSGDGSTGDFIVKLTGKVWNIEDFYIGGDVASGNSINTTVHNGDVCYYDGKLYVFKMSSKFSGSGETHGLIKDPGHWHLIGSQNVVSVSINLPENEKLLSRETIEDDYISDLRDFMNNQLHEYGIEWSQDDSKLVRYEVDGVPVTIPITDVDEWETSFTAEAGYLYFFFEEPVPGFTTLYGNEEHGIFDTAMQNNGQDVYIQNQTTVGSLNIAKNWEVEEGEDIPGKVVYAKVYRDNVDITDDLAGNATAYGLTDGDFYPSAGHYYLKVPVNASITLQGLEIAPTDPGSEAYQYVVQERGYGSGDTADYSNDVWDVGDIFDSYETSFSLRESTGSSEKPGYRYVEQFTESSTGSGSVATPVGAVKTVETTNSETGVKESNVVFTGGKAKVTISNSTSSLGSVRVTKVFSGIDASQIPEGFKINATWKAKDGSTQTRDLTVGGDLPADVKRAGEGLSYSWTIAGLPQGTEVTFTESGYEVEGFGVMTSPEESEGKVSATATADKVPGEARFANSYSSLAPIDLKIVKVDAANAATRLTGAQFELYRYEAVDDPERTLVMTAEVDANGELNYESLSEGYYKLVETKTPAGYVQTTSDPWFHIAKGDDGTLRVEVVEGSESVLRYSEVDDALFVANVAGEQLPATGGMGTRVFYAVGGLLVLAALAFLIRRSRK